MMKTSPIALSVLLLASATFFAAPTASAMEEEHRFFAVPGSQAGTEVSEVRVESMLNGQIVWTQQDPATGEVDLKGFDGVTARTIYTYSADEAAHLSGTSSRAVAFDACVAYKVPDFADTGYRWRVYDPTYSEPEEPLVSDGLFVIAEGKGAVWTRSVYASAGDMAPESSELRMYVCGSGMTTLAASTADGTQTGPAPFDPMFGSYGMNDGLVAWTVPRDAMQAGDVTTEVWVHDATGTRKTLECVYPQDCFLPSVGARARDLTDFQHWEPQVGVDGGVVALTTDDAGTFHRGVLIHQVASGASTTFIPGVGSYEFPVVRDGYVAWAHYDDTNQLQDIFVYDVASETTMQLPHDADLSGNFGSSGIFAMSQGMALYRDGGKLYLYDLSFKLRQPVAVNGQVNRLLSFRSGRLAIAEVEGNDLVLKFFDEATQPVEIIRLAQVVPDDVYMLNVDDTGQVWWAVDQNTTYSCLSDGKLATETAFDRDLFLWDAATRKVRQVTPAEESNVVYPTIDGHGGIAWWGIQQEHDTCGNSPLRDPWGNYSLYSPIRLFLGGQAVTLLRGTVSVVDGAHQRHGLPDVTLRFHWGINNTMTEMMVVHTDAAGHFQISPPVSGDVLGKGDLTIELKDRQGWIEVDHGKPPKLVTFDTAPFFFTLPTSAELNIDVTNTGAFRNPSVGAANQGRLDDLAEIYLFTHQAALFARTRLDLSMDDALPEEVHAYSAKSGVYHSSGAPEFINIEAAESGLTDNDWPDNREWHEFSHHIMADSLLGGDNQQPKSRVATDVTVEIDDNRNGAFDEKNLLLWSLATNPPHSILGAEGPVKIVGGVHVNHLGYANSSTTDSLVEGFAEFMSMVISDTMTTDPRPEIYKWGGTTTNIEPVQYAWRDEEFAVAALLWDLYDDHVDSYALWGKSLDDRVHLPLADLWSRLNRPSIRDMKDVYDALSDLTDDNDSDGIRDVDELFILHGFFVDSAPYRQYDNGETVGRAAYGRKVVGVADLLPDTLDEKPALWDNGNGVYDGKPADNNPTEERFRTPPNLNRRDKTIPEGSVIRLHFAATGAATGTGDAVSDITVHVEITYDDPYGAYSHGYDFPMDGDGDLPLHMPNLPATATITAHADGYEDDVPFTLRSESYWQAMEADVVAAAVDEHTFTLTALPSFAVAVTLGGDGFGTVTSAPAGIDCGNGCAKRYPTGTTVTLTATLEAGSRFDGWDSDCAVCAAETTCTLPADTDVACSAIFTLDVVGNETPVADGLVADTATGEAPLAVTFTCTGHDSDGTITGYRWDLDGDGTIDATTPDDSLTHTFDQAATYAATCTVVDDQGATATSDPVTITVAQPADSGTDAGGTTGGGQGTGGEGTGSGDGGSNNPGTDASGGGGGACFLTTVAYGSYLEPHAMELRHFRDRCRLTNGPGRRFVALYDRYAPPVSRVVAAHPSLRLAVRLLVTPVVVAAEYPLAALLVLLLLATLAAVVRRGWRMPGAE